MRGSPLPPSRPGLAELPETVRAQALHRWRVLRPHLEDGVPLLRAASEAEVALRTAQRWLTRYRAEGLAGLARAPRADRGTRRLPDDLRLLIEGLALRPPGPSAAHVHRLVVDVAKNEGWPVPSYATVYAIVRDIDPAMRTLALDGEKRYREVFDLIHRREAAGPNEVWQADHTQLDLWVIAPSGKPARPWLTVIEDDHSRAIAGYAVNLGAPSAIQTALALRQAIWRKSEPGWHVCGIPGTFYTDHGSDFASAHMQQVAADLRIRLVFSQPGKPRGRGKIERYFDTINQMCLPTLSGYAPRGTKDRAGQAKLSLAELDAAIGRFIVAKYNQRPHSETGQPPQARWDATGFLPHLPASLEQLDLLLLTIAKPRKVHPDGIHLFGVRYLDTTVLGEYVGESVTIRYDPRDIAEIRVFHDEKFLCRAICPELAAQSIGIKEITAARNARRRGLAHGLTHRASVVDRLLAVHQPPEPSPSPPLTDPAAPVTPVLRLYRED
ncbi:Mu transposase C-terminal domain-containing protein [Salinispora sp. H7-4]|uniref:Mu transposase C-terminal domain-containing protein n=1 Tax=Salinispora sp. H7-4 TaxID=2748321 RepID=UPI001C553A99|nr:Mu transposase C-terminal domain-containing protein [Salinispora sp. H7-4]